MKTAMSSSCSVQSPAPNQFYGLPIKGTQATLWAAAGDSTISFRCERNRNEVDASISAIYNAIIRDEAYTLFTQTTACTTESVIGCGNKRDFLSECACPTLNRVTNYRFRQTFETSVINKALEIIDQGATELNLAFFASGGLHGEDVLMIKLINVLREQKKDINIQVFLIDLAYASYIDRANSKVNAGTQLVWDDLTGGLSALKQFLTEITLSAPSFIKVKGKLFRSSQSYAEFAINDPSIRYDLLIGADIGNTLHLVQQMQRLNISRQNLDAIMLIKNLQEQAQLCQIHALSGKRDCDAIGFPSFEESWEETNTSLPDQRSLASNQRPLYEGSKEEEESDILQTLVYSEYPSGSQQVAKEASSNSCQIS